jgi:putative endonuclease
MWHLYIIEKRSKYYTGITSNLQKRIHQHGNPTILYRKTFDNKFQAARREKEIKGWSRHKKELLFTEVSGVSLP